ncbi:MAG TPA: hypothetical protein VNZ45_15435 [Bacteroidia bacterium]|nr:hypothetical protein [Bacteroidia bacterium]
MSFELYPTLPGYLKWVRNIMAVPLMVLPNNSPYIELSFDLAHTIVNLYLNYASPMLYTQAVYNLGGDYLVNMAQDNPSLPPPNNTYWADLRQSLGVNGFLPGLINQAEDQGTSAAVKLLSSMENLTLMDLQNLKTPWGRVYLGIAQSVGSMWGITT